MNPSNKQDLIFTAIMIAVLAVVVFTDAPAGYEECTTYGNRTECRGSDGSYREEYHYDNRTECRGDWDE